MAMRAANRGPQGINLLPRVNWSLMHPGATKNRRPHVSDRRFSSNKKANLPGHTTRIVVAVTAAIAAVGAAVVTATIVAGATIAGAAVIGRATTVVSVVVIAWATVGCSDSAD